MFTIYAIICIFKVLLRLGAHSGKYRLDYLMRIPYFAIQIERWGGEAIIDIPVTKEFQTDLTLINDLVAFLSSGRLPSKPHRMFQLIRLADFTGCDEFLQKASRELGTTVHDIDNSNTIKHVRSTVRKRYRWASLQARKLGGQDMCSMCRKPIMPGLPSLPKITAFPCCGKRVHSSCSEDPVVCPCCNCAFRLLPCCFCKKPIGDKEMPHYHNWMFAVTNRTSCCGADLHHLCQSKFNELKNCPACYVPIKNGKMDYHRSEALDIVHVRIWRSNFESCRRNPNQLPFTHMYNVSDYTCTGILLSMIVL